MPEEHALVFPAGCQGFTAVHINEVEVLDIDDLPIVLGRVRWSTLDFPITDIDGPCILVDRLLLYLCISSSIWICDRRSAVASTGWGRRCLPADN